MRTPSEPEKAHDSAAERPESSASGLVPLLPVGPATDDVPTIITGGPSGTVSDSLALLRPGMLLGHFELIDSIGSGGMASVLKARDTQLGRVVALKILPPQMAQDPDSITRFKNEARAAARLDHDQIARVFFCGEDRGLHFIAFEFVEGENLRQRMDRVGKISPAEAVRYMLQVAAGLAHAAERGVVHRDIKPSNIIITPDGRAKIVDMGLARLMSHQSVHGGVTHSGMTLGTFDYISPEQALDPRKADVRSDIYSLGCTMYHALTGRPPVPEGTAAKKLHAHQHEDVIDPRELNRAISDDLALILSKMMAKSPSRRYQTPQELIAALTVVARQLNLSAETVAIDPALLPANPSSIQLIPPPPRFPLSVVVGVVLVGLMGFFLWQGRSLPTANPNLLDDSPASGRAVSVATSNPPPTPPPPAPPQTENGLGTAKNARELVELLSNPAVTTIRLLSDVKYDLKAAAPQGLSVSNRRLTLEGPSGNSPAQVRLSLGQLDSLLPTAARPGSLTFHKCEQLRFRGVQFVFAEGPPSEDPMTPAVGLLCSDVKQIEFVECRFDADRDMQSVDATAVSLGQDRADPATAAFRYCWFNFRRGYGVQCLGRWKVDVMESAASPHPAVFALKAEVDPASQGELTLQQSTFVIDRGAVAEVEDAARWTVSAGYCVFTQPSTPSTMVMMEPTDRRPAVVRALGEKLEGLAVQLRGLAGEANAYFRVDPLAVRLKGFSFEEAGRLAPAAVQDAGAIDLKLLPLHAEDFLVEVQKPEVWRAFRLKANYQPLQVRRAGVGLLGARFLPSRELPQIYPAWPPPVQSETLEANVKIWWPEPPEDKRDTLPRNIYTELDAALAALKPGDELRIRHSGPLIVPPQTLNKPKLRATIKPENGSTPVLLLGESEYAEPSLFRLVDGDELTLEGLDIRLKPTAPGSVKPLAVVTVVGGSRTVNFKNCILTLDPQDEATFSAVVLAQPTGGEMRTSSDRRPQVRLENCFIRGRGRGVAVPQARPFELELDNCLTVLAGPLLEVDPSSKPVADGLGSSRVSLSRVTTIMSGPLLDFRVGSVQGSKLPNWVVVDVEAERCLVAAADRGIPVVRLEGGADLRDPLQLFHWQSRGPNWFANFNRNAIFLEWLAPSEPTLSKTWEADAWMNLIQEKAETSLGRVNFQSFLAGRRLTTALPTDFKVLSVTMTGAAADDAGARINRIATPIAEK